MKSIKHSVFVNHSTSGCSRRDHELQKAAALSYAARTSHQRRHLQRVLSETVPSGSRTRVSQQICFVLQDLNHTSKRPKRKREIKTNRSPAKLRAESDQTDFDEVEQRRACSSKKTPKSRSGQSDRHRADAAHCRVETLESASSFPFPPQFGCYRGELFSAIPNGDRQDVRAIVDFCLGSVNPPNDLLTEIFDVQNVYPKYVPFLGNPVFHHAGLSVVGLFLERALDRDSRPSSDLLMHKGQALAAVRGGLERFDLNRNSLIPEGLLTAIVFLAIFEGTMGNFNVVRHHLQGLKKIIDAVGGFLGLPKNDFFIESTMVIHFESLFVFAGLESVFKKERRAWQKVYVSPPFANQTLEALKRLPPGFCDLIRDAKLTEDTVSIVDRAVKLNITNDTLAQARERVSRRLEARKYTDVMSACPILGVSDSIDCLFEKSLCQTIKIFCGIAVDTVRSRTLSFTSTLIYLSAKLPILHPDILSEKRCLMWMYMVVIDAHRTGFERCNIAPTGMSLLARLTRLLSGFFLEDWRDVEEFLNSFFWTEGLSRFWRRKWVDLKKEAQSYWLSTSA